MRIKAWMRRYTQHLGGKTVAITGATGGLGRELCRQLLSLGASLVLVDRNVSKQQDLCRALRAAYPAADIRTLTADMADMASVSAACDALEKMPPDVLILNAGAYSIPRPRCDSGYDAVFQINFVAPYYMARRLMPHLRHRGGRVVAVGSIAHRYAAIDPDDIDFSNRSAASLAYGNAKRHLMFALHALFRDERDVSFALVHPGITQTGITAHYPKWLYAIIRYPMKVIFMRPQTAALSLVRGVFDATPDGCWWGPWCLDIWGRPALRRLRGVGREEQALIAARGEQIWQNLNAGNIRRA